MSKDLLQNTTKLSNHTPNQQAAGPAHATTHDAPQAAQGKLGIQRIYVKNQSAKTHNAPAVFNQDQDAKPETTLELNIQNRPIDKNQFEVSLLLHLTLKIQQQTALVVELEQSGVFQVEDFTETQLAHILGAYCPSILFPYARKILADLMLASGFAAITLPPVNFDQMHQERLKQAEESESKKATAGVRELETVQ